MAGTTVTRAFLLIGVVLTAQLWRCTAYAGDGFSVEFIHRDSLKSPFHDPSLTAPERMLAAARRSTARAAALTRSFAAGGSPDGAVSQIIGRPFEYLMYVNVGTPPIRMLALVDTGSDLLWLRCSNDTTAQPPNGDFNPSNSSTFGRVGCDSAACRALTGTSCGTDGSSCMYDYKYASSYDVIGVLSTETFTFEDAPGGCVGCRDRPQLRVANVNFGCTTSTFGVFGGDGVVGLGDGTLSLVSQIGADTSFGRRFSYCLAPFSAPNASSALNFGSRAAVTEQGAVTAVLFPSQGDAFHIIALEDIKIGNATFALPSRKRYDVVLDTGSMLTYLARVLLDPMVEELKRRINLPTVPSPDHTLQLCYDVNDANRRSLFEKNVPDITLQLIGQGAPELTLKPENMFAELQEGFMCLAVAPVTDQQPLALIGCIAQQNLHIGYDLDKGTVTLANADCASSYQQLPSAPV
ncbi:probable aspartic protease At2g35615 [Lolium rigidum]|uniref:probable aspartic protease At2g35615 n=1 Tax=Lolium rigidum TaxID=89674 RepID=UPI001F5C36BE|nr:probable aspartic protease At2g35615 [Lolium rigidum]